jgi:hypothetical protein
MFLPHILIFLCKTVSKNHFSSVLSELSKSQASSSASSFFSVKQSPKITFPQSSPNSQSRRLPPQPPHFSLQNSLQKSFFFSPLRTLRLPCSYLLNTTSSRVSHCNPRTRVTFYVAPDSLFWRCQILALERRRIVSSR